MNKDRTERKLSAKLSAEVVDYSRLMEAYEAWTIGRVIDEKKMSVPNSLCRER